MATLANVLAPAQPDLGPTVATTGATQTVVARFRTEPDTAYFVEAKVVAVRTSDYAAAGTWWRQGCFLNDGGSLAVVGAIRTVVTDNETTAGYDVTLDVATEDVDDNGVNEKTIQVLVTGAAATAVTWRAVVDIQKIQ